MRVILTLLFATLAALCRAEESGNLHSVLNAFVASVAKDHPEFKADITLWSPDQSVKAGYQVGQSAQMGTYQFRPKVWDELSDKQKEAVLKEPGLKAFIVSLRNARIYPAVSAANPARPAVPGWFPVEGAKPIETEYRVRIAADEMVRNRTVVIPVEPTPVKK